jgi:hypothetical protein
MEVCRETHTHICVVCLWAHSARVNVTKRKLTSLAWKSQFPWSQLEANKQSALFELRLITSCSKIATLSPMQNQFSEATRGSFGFQRT